VALAEVARFATLSEALVAKTALDANGIPATVFDVIVGTNLWTHQSALMGIRLVAHLDQVEEARAFIRSRRAGDASTISQSRKPSGVGDASLFLLAIALFATTGANAYCLSLLRERFTPVRLAVFLAEAALAVSLLALWLILAFHL
jgi:hypothetical protein